MATETQHESKTKLLDAALHVIRVKGYAATTVDDICHEAGVTKGSFFHHFKSKDELALAATSYWGTKWSAESVGYFMQTVLQGSFIFAKATQSPDVVRGNLAHLRRYLEALFTQPTNAKRKEK